MTTGGKVAIFAGLFLLIGGIALAATSKTPPPVTGGDDKSDTGSDKTNMDIDVKNTNVIIPSTTTTTKRDDSFPLGIGSRGQKVSNLQNALNSFYGASLKVDSIFGKGTESALTAAFIPTKLDYRTYDKVMAAKKFNPPMRRA